MNNERVIAQWFRNDYSLSRDGWLLPLDKTPMNYDPLNLTTIGSNKTDSLYLQFLNIDSKNADEIRKFYNDFGPLGSLSRVYESVGIYDDENQGSLWVAPYLGTEYIRPLSDIASEFRFDGDRFYDIYASTNEVPELIELQKLAGESVEFFNKEQDTLKSLLDLYVAIKSDEDNAIEVIKECLIKLNISNGEEKWIAQNINSEIRRRAITELINILNKEIGDIPEFRVVCDPYNYEISKEIQWNMRSLLSYIYYMFINDIVDGVQIGKCVRCGNYYRGGRPEAKYCGSSCQNRAKTKRYQDQIRHVQKMHRSGKSIDEIAVLIGKDEKIVRKWVELGKE